MRRLIRFSFYKDKLRSSITFDCWSTYFVHSESSIYHNETIPSNGQTVPAPLSSIFKKEWGKCQGSAKTSRVGGLPFSLFLSLFLSLSLYLSIYLSIFVSLSFLYFKIPANSLKLLKSLALMNDFSPGAQSSIVSDPT